MDREAVSSTGVDGDARLIALARGGDQAAWTAIVELHWKQVWSLSWTIVRDRHGAEEVTQETFRAVKEKLAAYRGDGALCGWIQTICRHQALDELRRRGRLAREVSIDGSPGLDGGAMAAGEERWVQHMDLEIALATLEEDEREALLLTEAGYTSEEVAKALGVAPTTIRSRKARARARLLLQLEGGEEGKAG